MFYVTVHASFYRRGVNSDFPLSTSRTDCSLDPVPILWGQHVCSHHPTRIVHLDSCLLGSVSACVCVPFLRSLPHSCVRLIFKLSRELTCWCGSHSWHADKAHRVPVIWPCIPFLHPSRDAPGTRDNKLDILRKTVCKWPPKMEAEERLQVKRSDFKRCRCLLTLISLGNLHFECIYRLFLSFFLKEQNIKYRVILSASFGQRIERKGQTVWMPAWSKLWAMQIPHICPYTQNISFSHSFGCYIIPWRLGSRFEQAKSFV